MASVETIDRNGRCLSRISKGESKRHRCEVPLGSPAKEIRCKDAHGSASQACDTEEGHGLSSGWWFAMQSHGPRWEVAHWNSYALANWSSRINHAGLIANNRRHTDVLNALDHEPVTSISNVERKFQPRRNFGAPE